jgi:hypothetical protein
MATNGGEAANYYNQPGYPPPPPQQPDYSNNGPTHYAPPPYPPQGQADQKLEAPPTYDEVFAIQKPKWNDLWAGLLFLATCAGFVVVSAISIQGYGASSSMIDHD